MIDKNKKAIAAAAVAAAFLTLTGTAADAAKPGMEKCAGIVKAGMNDCGTAGHKCAGMSKADGGADEWIYVPAGTCEKIVGGTVKEAAKKEMKDKM